MSDDLVSIIMPSHNCGQFVGDAIRSIINQTYTNWELLVVDDCSEDDTQSVVQSFRDPRIRYLRNEERQGAALTRNRALREAKGCWMAFLDSDDLWFPDKLEHQIRFMEEHNYHFTYTDYVEIDVQGRETGVHVTGPKHINKWGMWAFCWPGCLTVMYDAKHVGLIQIRDIRRNNDYDMWLKVINKADCYLLKENLAQYRRGRKGSVSTQQYVTLIKWHYLLFRVAEQKSVFTSVILTCRNLFYGVVKKLLYVHAYTSESR